MKTIDKIIYKVNTKFGAPMGRANVGNYPVTITSVPHCRITKKHNKKNRVFDCAVPMLLGGYDKGGAYWGHGKQLRVKYTKDLTYIEFYRVN